MMTTETLTPGTSGRKKHRLQTMATRPTDAEHRLQAVAAESGHKLAPIADSGDPMQVAADAPKLTERAHESQ